jgi:hypothetical protein
MAWLTLLIQVSFSLSLFATRMNVSLRSSISIAFFFCAFFSADCVQSDDEHKR